MAPRFAPPPLLRVGFLGVLPTVFCPRPGVGVTAPFSSVRPWSVVVRGVGVAPGGGVDVGTALKAAPASEAAALPSAGEAATARRPNALWLALPSLFTAGLGTWQMGRREEKAAMVSERKLRLATPPREWKAAADGQDVPEGTRVHATGRFVGPAVRVGPRPRTLPGTRDTRRGFAIVQAFQPGRDDASASWWRRRARESKSAEPFLVVRGWVPEDWADDETGAAHTSLSAVVRASEDPSMFVPRNHPEKNSWFYIDAPAIAEALGLPKDAPIVEAVRDDVDEDGDEAPATRRIGHVVSGTSQTTQFPLVKDASELLSFKVSPQEHLNYAATWYTLSGITATMALRASRMR